LAVAAAPEKARRRWFQITPGHLLPGHRTSDAARKFDMSPASVSRLRRELKAAWDEFIGEGVPHFPAAVPA
jgi:hypothetical protein